LLHDAKRSSAMAATVSHITECGWLTSEGQSLCASIAVTYQLVRRGKPQSMPDTRGQVGCAGNACG
jgi:hypothetical protein